MKENFWPSKQWPDILFHSTYMYIVHTHYLDVLLYKSLLFKLPLTQSIMLILVIRQIFKFSITKRTTKFDLIFILDFKYRT